MDDQVKIMLPKLGESIVSATVLQWFKKVGDSVALDEPLLEVSTDKVNSEIPSPIAGVIKEICAHPDQEVQVGELLAVLSAGSRVSSSAPVKQEQKVHACCNSSQSQAERNTLSPAVLSLLQEKGIPLSEIDRIPRTGQEGRLTKKDVESFCAQPVKSCQADPSLERVKMTGLRKAIAENMVKSFYGAPHASLITEVDVTNLVKIIKERKRRGLRS